MNLHTINMSIYQCMKTVACCHSFTHFVKHCSNKPCFECLHLRPTSCSHFWETLHLPQTFAASLQKSHLYTQKSPVYPQKSPLYPQKSPVYLHKRNAVLTCICLNRDKQALLWMCPPQRQVQSCQRLPTTRQLATFKMPRHMRRGSWPMLLYYTWFEMYRVSFEISQV